MDYDGFKHPFGGCGRIPQPIAVNITVSTSSLACWDDDPANHQETMLPPNPGIMIRYRETIPFYGRNMQVIVKY